jgi:hypothetical protein
MTWQVIFLLGVGVWGGFPKVSVSPDQASGMVSSITSMVTGSVADLIERSPPGLNASPMFNRKTQAPLMWIHLRKAQPILVNREFYNISNVPGMNVTMNLTAGAMLKRSSKPQPATIQQMIPSSFIEHKGVDPIMIQNGLYLTMPLRKPAQETVNVAAVEDTRTIQAFSDYMRKKREIRKLNKNFRNLLKQLTTDR